MLFTKLIYKLSISPFHVPEYYIQQIKKPYLTLYVTNTIDCRYTVIGKRMEGGKDLIDIEQNVSS